MVLQIFNFIDDVTNLLEESRAELETISKKVESYLEEIVITNSEGYLNTNTRVKSSISLKEKILRNNYYKKYSSPSELLSNLSDLIGIRIECRFIKDEDDIYSVLRKHFCEIYSDGLYYNPLNENIRLDLNGMQPQKQKNGFEIYRIDGVYEDKNRTVNFEVQIKSLVNIFWSEIEHKVIYKNYNYIIEDNFFRDMMFSIKRNLTMIDNQLLIIYNQSKNLNSIDSSYRKYQMRTLLSKIIYDIFSIKIKNSLGFIVDFRKPCDIIMQYIFRTNNVKDIDDYNNTLLTTLNRFNAISKNEIDFESEITFEKGFNFEDEFINIVGNNILNSVNYDFQWNIFFKILFEIEPGNNAEDFENFLKFFKNSFYGNKSFSKLFLVFNDNEAEDIVNSSMIKIAHSFNKINSIAFIYENNIKEVNETIDSFVELICRDIGSYQEWQVVKDVYLELFYLKTLSIFNSKVSFNETSALVGKIKKCSSSKIGIDNANLKYFDELDKTAKMKASEVLNLFII